MNHSPPQSSTSHRLNDARLAHERKRERKQTIAEIERTAQDLAFEADILNMLAEVSGDPALGEIATDAFTLADRVMAVHDKYLYPVKGDE